VQHPEDLVMGSVLTRLRALRCAASLLKRTKVSQDDTSTKRESERASLEFRLPFIFEPWALNQDCAMAPWR
jgi:hypothetical protein